MLRRPPRSTRTDTLFPYTTLFRSSQQQVVENIDVALDRAVLVELCNAQPNCIAAINLDIAGDSVADGAFPFGKRTVQQFAQTIMNPAQRLDIFPCKRCDIEVFQTAVYFGEKFGREFLVTFDFREIEDRKSTRLNSSH